VEVLVTGGSGVVGGAVLRHLVAAGHRVRGLSRSTPSDGVIVGLGAQPVRGDILDREAVRSAVEGVEIVFHVAGVNEMCSPDPARMIRANVEGSLAVVAAARDAGVARVVYTSSAAALGEEAGTVGSETSPHRGWYLSDYERSKHLAEQAVMAETGIEVVAVNPSSVQGPGRATGTGKLILDLARGSLPALVDTRISIVDIDDCARGHLLAAVHGRPGERYVLNSFTVGIREAVTLLEETLGRPVRVRFLPGPVAAMGAALVEAAFRLGRRRPPLCREMVRTIRHGHAYDGSKAAGELGLEYTSARALLGKLVAWFESEGLIDG
jgi:dihydroflavonol-4-reductase